MRKPQSPIPEAANDLPWAEFLAESRDKPWLLHLLAKRGAVIFLRYRLAYQRLSRLRPGQLRRLQRRLGLTLAGAALLLALSSGPILASPNNTITVDGVNCKLADAVFAANEDREWHGCSAGSGADTLNIIADLSLSSAAYDAPPPVESDITIEGNGHTIARENTIETFNIFGVQHNGRLYLKNVTISGGTSYYGGGISCRTATLTVENSTITGNAADEGGGIYVEESCSATVRNSTISGNTANYYGGGIGADNHATLTVENSTITGNSANDGGGIFGEDYSILTIQDNTTIANNTAADGGGVSISRDSTITVENSTITGNSATGYDGGGIKIMSSSTLTLRNSTISDNSAPFNGGGIHGVQSTITVEDSTISDNHANSDHGGGIYIYNGGSVTVKSSAVTGNIAGDYGGGVYAGLASAVTVQNSTISGNSAAYGGGILSDDNQTAVTVENSTISNNSANSGNGGGVYCHTGSVMTIRNSIIANQAADEDCRINGGSVTSEGYNIESGTSCGFSSIGDMQNMDPRLNALSNGVMTPKSDSPAIDGGNPADPGSGGDACLADDQRGNARDDLRCDIGAVEVQLSDTDTVVKDVTGAGTFTFGPTLVKIQVTTQGGLSQLSVQHHDGDHPNATRMNGQWWGITSTGSGFIADLDLPHNVTPDANAKVCKHVSSSTWDCDRDGSDADRVWRNGLSAFSDWSVGNNVGPNAVLLQTVSARSEPVGACIALWSGAMTLLAGVATWLGLRREADVGKGR